MMFDGKVALVTGAASGIGRAAALIFAREGAAVAVADRDVAGGERVAAEIADAAGRAISVETDVTSEAAIRAMVDRTVAAFGGLDAAFNNPGTPGAYATVTSCDEDEWDWVIDINMRSVWWCRSTKSLRCSSEAAAGSSTPHRAQATARRRRCSPMSRTSTTSQG